MPKFENYDMTNGNLINVVDLDIPETLHSLFSSAEGYNQSGVFVQEKVDDKVKYVLSGPLYVMIDFYMYESNHIFYLPEEELIILEGPKGTVKFDVNDVNIVDIDLRRYV